MKRRMLIGVFALIAMITAALLAACGSASDDGADSKALFSGNGGKVSVQVVAQSVEQSRTAESSSYAKETNYYYDSDGKLLTAESEDTRREFEYDSVGMLSKATTYYQYSADSGWQMAREESFFPNQARNIERYESVIYQGDGSTSFDYQYDSNGRPVSGTSEARSNAGADMISSSSITWAYQGDGKLESYVSNCTDTFGYSSTSSVSLNYGKSDPANGTFVYDGDFGSVDTLHFNPDGTLESIMHEYGSNVSAISYKYKTVTVDTSSYTPTIFSNPQGFEPMIMPCLSKDVIDALMRG